MLSRLKTSTLSGIDAKPVEVEVRTQKGTRRFTIIGLADNAVRESKDRVESAIRHSGFKLPNQVLVNLAPADLKKEGTAFDLPIALGILAASRQVPKESLVNRSFYGELALDGGLKPIKGCVACAIEAKQSGCVEMVVPYENVQEASLVEGLSVIGASRLGEVIKYFVSGEIPNINKSLTQNCAKHTAPKTFDEVKGQESAKRALLIAASGGHNVLMIGPPGCGKSMLAERFPSLLPQLSEEEKLDSIRIYSACGHSITDLLTGERPIRSPHHVVSDIGLVGGGTTPRPGEITLAHNGVLFLDEFPEFRRSALEALRQPLEAGIVSVTRAKAQVIFPSDFQLIAAMNPCPCGRLGSSIGTCQCTGSMIQMYLKKLSQPILDRIDLHITLEPVPISQFSLNAFNGYQKNESEKLREIVLSSRNIQIDRQGFLNSKLQMRALTSDKNIMQDAILLLEVAAKKIGLSARGFVRVLRTARTIADLAMTTKIQSDHIAEAIGLRKLERIEQFCSSF